MVAATLVVSLLAYTGFLVGALYFCVFADPNDSAVAMFLTVTVPRKMWITLEKTLGNKALSVVEVFVDRALLLVYCLVVFGSWSIIFAYIYPWIDKEDRVSSNHKYVGYVVFAACVASWRKACTTSPGLITAKNIKRYDHFPYDELMFVPGQICKSRNIPRLARSKFDRFKYHESVPRYDHFCGWVYNTIGEENYRWFLLFLAVHVGMCAYGAYVTCCLFYGEILDNDLLHVTFFDRFTGEEIRASPYIIFQYLFNRHLPEAGCLAIMFVMCIALSCFLLYHVWLTSCGLTTNESYKWDQVQRWHKRELKRYKDAVKNGEILGIDQPGSQPVVSDGDVTCTPGVGGTNEVAEYDENAIVDPGPAPENIYNRGFVENWKEVIFPLSLRKQNDGPVRVSKPKKI